MGDNPIPCEVFRKEARGGSHGYSTHDVRATRLLTLWRAGPYHSLFRNEQHRAAADELRRSSLKDTLRANEHSGTEWGIHLVCRHCEEINGLRRAEGSHIDRSVGRKLGRVDEKHSTSCVHHARDCMYVWYYTCDIGP